MNTKQQLDKEYYIGFLAGALAITLSVLFILLIFLDTVSAELTFISPINNSTTNSSIVELTVILSNNSSTLEDFYYLINNNTDGTERVYPDENYSALVELLDGEHTIYAIYKINGIEFNESVYFIVNTTIVNETIVPPVVTPPSSGGGSSGGSSHACTPEKWNCTEWNECKNGVQYRSCVYNKCKPTIVKPTENITCYVAPIVTEVKEEPKPVVTENKEVVTAVPETVREKRSYTWLWIIAIALVVIIGLYQGIKYWMEGRNEEYDNSNWTSQPNNGLPELPSRNE